MNGHPWAPYARLCQIIIFSAVSAVEVVLTVMVRRADEAGADILCKVRVVSRPESQ